MSLSRPTKKAKAKPRVQCNTPAMFARKGWSMNAAAKHLGITVGHLRGVIAGERQSNRLMVKVKSLPNLKD